MLSVKNLVVYPHSLACFERGKMQNDEFGMHKSISRKRSVFYSATNPAVSNEELLQHLLTSGGIHT